MKHTEIRNEISKKTGCHELLVEEILSMYSDILIDSLINNMSVQLKNLGTLSLIPTPPRVNKLSKDGGMTDWAYVFSFKSNISIRPYLKEKIRNLPDEVKAQYIKKKD